MGIADDVNSVYYNPAGLGLLKRPELTLMHTQYFQSLSYDYGAFVQPLSRGALALSAVTLKADDLTRRGNDEGSQGSFENQDAAYAASYAHALNETMALGVTARWIQQKIDSASAEAWSGDLGVIKRFDTLNPLSVGFAVRHLGPKITFHEEGDPQPLTLDAGAAVDLLQDRLKLALDARHVRDSGLQFGMGAEWRQQIGPKFRYAARGGYNTANTDDDATGMSLGAGVGYDLFTLDFAWIPFGNLGNTFRYTAHLKF